MNKLHEWVNTLLIAAVFLVVLVGGNQSVPNSAVGASGTRFPNGISANTTSPSVGQVLATTLAVTSTSLFSGLVRTAAGLVESGQNTLAITSGTYTLTQADMLNSKVLTVPASTTAAALTLTLPATSTMTTLIPNAGDTQEWIIDNLRTNGATTTTLTAGTGIDIDGITANDDVINGDVSARLECWRLVTTDVRCIVEEMVDAG